MVDMARYTAVVKGDYLQGRVSDMATTCISPGRNSYQVNMPLFFIGRNEILDHIPVPPLLGIVLQFRNI